MSFNCKPAADASFLKRSKQKSAVDARLWRWNVYAYKITLICFNVIDVAPEIWLGEWVRACMCKRIINQTANNTNRVNMVLLRLLRYKPVSSRARLQGSSRSLDWPSPPRQCWNLRVSGTPVPQPSHSRLTTIPRIYKIREWPYIVYATKSPPSATRTRALRVNKKILSILLNGPVAR